MDIDSIISQMTLEDKIAICEGKNFWETRDFAKYGIPSLFMSDGPHGLRKQNTTGATDTQGINNSLPATCFPSEVTTAGSWDPDLLSQIGKAIAEEAKTMNVGLVLGPGANMKRNPRCGRNFEYFSEDPVLAGELAAGFISGAEKEGIGTSLKHFACNSQELGRLTSDGIIDERTLREVYLTAFEIAVKKGKPSTLMCSYPKINGVHSSDNRKLLTDILRTEWGYDGMVVTDWGAMNDKISAFMAGCDLNMPGGSAYMSEKVKAAVESGTLPEKYIDNSVRRILKLVFRARKVLADGGEEKTDAHHILARRAAEKGAVLLKNDDNCLPIDIRNEKIAVIGAMAENLRIQGAGSSHINPTRTEQFMDYMNGSLYSRGCMDDGSTTDVLIAQAAETARKADKVLVFAGLPGSYESEGFDRDNLKMPEGHIRMINAVAEANKNTVVVLICGSAVECPWADKVKAILYMGLPGQGGAGAIYNLVTGIANPCGKLAESWPYSYSDVPSSDIYDMTKDALYEEGIYIGYRYYEKAGIKPRFPFGYGLSYTSFKYSGLKVSQKKISVKIKNTGKVKGEEVVQLYVGLDGQNGIHRPVRELKAFTKVELDPEEEKTVTLELNDRAFSVWDNGWKTEKGEYIISVGPLSKKLDVGGEILNSADKDSWYWTLRGKPNLRDLEKATGSKYIPRTVKKGSYSMESTIAEMKDKSLVMKALYKATEMVVAKPYGGKPDYNNPEFRMMMECSAGGPMRNMIISSGISSGLFEGALDIANGHIISGIKKIIKH